jgi:hypothetical protein
MADLPSRRFLRWWAAAWTGLLVLLFTAVTVLTLAVWASDSASAETSPFSDLVFFALGMLIATGFAVQIRSPERNGAGLLQAGAASLCLAIGGIAGSRVEPMVGGFVFLAALVVMFLLEPSRRAAMRFQGKPSPLVLGMAVVAAVPCVSYALRTFKDAAAAGPSCFLGQCAAGDRLAEVGATALAIAMLTVIAGLRVAGWKLPMWSAALTAILIGVVSLVLPGETGALGTWWSVVAIAWGALLSTVGGIRLGDRAASE